jgi:hypothetical protein
MMSKVETTMKMMKTKYLSQFRKTRKEAREKIRMICNNPQTKTNLTKTKLAGMTKTTELFYL